MLKILVILVKKILLGLITLSTITSYALTNVDKFEGSINLKRETIYDTSYVIIHVKNDRVRVDEYDNHKKLVNIYLIDLGNEDVLALSPTKKLFYKLNPNGLANQIAKDTVVIKTQNRMVLDGESCCQLRVKCKSKDTEIAFWVTEKNFDFLLAMYRILQRVKPDVSIFSYFPNVKGKFPMLIVERTLLRKERQKVLVTAIQESHLSEALFRVPLGYQKIAQ